MSQRLRYLIYVEHRQSGRWLARKAGISRATMSRILRGERDLYLEEARAIADALGVPLSRVTDDEHPRTAA